MGFADTVRGGVASIDVITADLQVPITHHAWIGITGTNGQSNYAPPVTIMAVVDNSPRLRRTTDLREVLQRAEVIIPRPVTPNGASGRREPIDPRDKIVLPDGYTGPIFDIEGVIDPATNKPYASVIRMR